jgi:hypothetical protein
LALDTEIASNAEFCMLYEKSGGIQSDAPAFSAQQIADFLCRMKCSDRWLEHSYPSQKE